MFFFKTPKASWNTDEEKGLETEVEEMKGGRCGGRRGGGGEQNIAHLVSLDFFFSALYQDWKKF